MRRVDPVDASAIASRTARSNVSSGRAERAIREHDELAACGGRKRQNPRIRRRAVPAVVNTELKTACCGRQSVGNAGRCCRILIHGKAGAERCRGSRGDRRGTGRAPAAPERSPGIRA